VSLIVKKAENQIYELIKNAAAAAIEKGLLPENDLPDFTVEIPAERSHGDYSTNAALVSARVFRLPPAKIAAILCENIELEGTYFESCSVAGAGFINFNLSGKYYADVLLDVIEKGGDYGRSSYGEGKRVLVEFVSANPTGPMHIGNARNGAIGDCLASLLSWAGYYAEREFYVNDTGNQILKLGLSLDVRYLQLYLEGIEMPEDAYHGEDITEHAKAFAAIHGDKYISLPEEERRQVLVDFALPKNIQSLREDLLRYRISYDTWFLESSLHNSGEVDRVLRLLVESGHTYESEGAVWFKAVDFGCDKDFVLLRSNGLPTYIVPDIAYHYNKLVTRGFDKAINILGADHHGHMMRLKATVDALIGPERLEIVLYQMVRLLKDGETIKLSKRSGKAITLVTLLDEVPTDAARFFFNLREANTHCDFDLGLAVEQSAKNPVYYCQYAHARICSIIGKLREKGALAENVSPEELLLLSEPEEKELIRHIASLTGLIVFAAENRDPSKITKYVLDLATLFHKFYNSCRVDVPEENLRTARLFLCIAVKTIMKNMLGLLNIDAPESM